MMQFWQCVREAYMKILNVYFGYIPMGLEWGRENRTQSTIVGDLLGMFRGKGTLDHNFRSRED
jgi:hypothetical protein